MDVSTSSEPLEPKPAIFPPAGTWVVYLLRLRDDSLYCGMTNDLSLRLSTHARGKGAKLVRAKSPFFLAWYEILPQGSRSAAQVREAEIKSMKRTEKLTLLAQATNPVKIPILFNS